MVNPTRKQLLAVWRASQFIVDYADDDQSCAICDGTLPGHDDHEKDTESDRHGMVWTIRHCTDDCPGNVLRKARTPVETTRTALLAKRARFVLGHASTRRNTCKQ